MKVEFRLLQVVLSAVSGDRVTVALVHWDGVRMRVASSPTALTVVDTPARAGIRAAVDEFVRKAHRRARQLERTPELNVGLAHAFPVREGMGAALCWTPISSRETLDAEAHFLELRQEARLVHDPLHRARRVTERKIYDGLVSLGEELRAEPAAAAWVRTTHAVSYKMKFEVPLSWKNGAWHHAVPFSLDGLLPRALDDEIRRVYGLVDLSLPPADVTVLVPAMPTSSAVAAQAERDLRALRLMLKPKRSVELFQASTDGQVLDLERLGKRVRRDIRSH
jgi:hypothetical protein